MPSIYGIELSDDEVMMAEDMGIAEFLDDNEEI
mgnify:CR=1 FL=1